MWKIHKNINNYPYINKRKNYNKTKIILIKYILSRKIYSTRKGVLLKF